MSEPNTKVHTGSGKKLLAYQIWLCLMGEGGGGGGGTIIFAVK